MSPGRGEGEGVWPWAGRRVEGLHGIVSLLPGLLCLECVTPDRADFLSIYCMPYRESPSCGPTLGGPGATQETHKLDTVGEQALDTN